MGQAPSAPRAAVMCPFSLHSPQPGRTTACPCDCLCVRVCFSLSPSQSRGVCVCCFKIRGAITLFAKYNKGKSLSWRCRCRTASTANVVDESTGTRQLVERVCLFNCVCVCWYPFTGVCARVLFSVYEHAHARSQSAGRDNREASQLVTMTAAESWSNLPEEGRITTSISLQNLPENYPLRDGVSW